MSFFQQLAALQLIGTLKLTIRMDGNQQQVAILLDNEKCGDDARKAIPPLLLKGTAEELDAGFFETISQPMQQVSGLQVAMEAHLKGVEEAMKKAAMNKPAEKAKETKPTEKPAAEVKPKEPPKPSQASIFDLAEDEPADGNNDADDNADE